jgi:hypothetical protein
MPGRPFISKPLLNSTATHFVELPSPSIDEKGLGEIPPGDYPLGLAQEAVRVLRLAVENSYKSSVAIHQDYTLPEGARHLRADEISFKITNRAMPVCDHALRAMKTEIAKLKLKTSAPIVDTTVKGVAMSGEIRQALKSMAAGERRTAISKAIADGDDAVVAAIATAPVLLTGLSPLEVSTYTAQWAAKKYPGEMVRIRDLEKKLSFVEKAGELTMSYQRKMSSKAITDEARKFAQASADAQREALGVSH